MKRFALFITNIYLKLFYRVKLVDIDKIPAEGPVILCANHNSMLDMFFLGYKTKRWIHWMAKEELFKNPILAPILKSLDVFSVKRGSGDIGSIKNAYKLLSENKIIGIFPQGTRVTSKKKNKVRIKSGAALIAVKTGAPIVPAIVKGNYKLFSRIKVIFGEPFYLGNEGNSQYNKQDLNEMSNFIMNRIYSLAEVK